MRSEKDIIKKKPILAAVLNFILPGIGYLYLGKRKVFAYILIVSIIIPFFGEVNYRQSVLNILIFTTSFILFLFAFGYDAYTEAKELNKKNNSLNS